ncbi:MAG TPA: hypothetical protein VLS89_15785 [Candidatus Nanopelagicales bacterium]|nr:hypothetical protein [Candidatus Nanopelagicales bacterium]
MPEPACTPASPAAPVRVLLAIAAASLATACLPGDTRPVPESVYVTAEPSQALQNGFDTADGWRITFDRLVAAVGNVDFEWDDPSCSQYAEANYDRLFDFKAVVREKVGTIYGMGTCRVEFRLRDPSFDALLGVGVTAADLEFMRRPGRDRFVVDEDEGVSVRLIGSATRGDETKRFEWLFRRSYDFTNCKAEGDGYATTVELTEAQQSELRLEMRPEEFFRASADDAADLLFQPIADADADADGRVTLDELSQASRTVHDDTDATPGSLEDLVYGELLPRLLRVAGAGPCEAEDRGRR